MLLSIDVGIRNLAMCLMDYPRIVKWEVASVPAEREGGLFNALREHLNNRPWLRNVDTVVIEKQPDRNKKMKAIEHYLNGFFAGRGANTISFDARYKIPDVVGPGKKAYAKRKATAITRARDWIETDNNDWVEFFNKHTKKDDLADTVMQALAYLNQKQPEEPETKPAKKLTARKPTPNQVETKYSKSNLVWLWKNEDHDKLLKNKRFQRDLKRYFHSVDELIN